MFKRLVYILLLFLLASCSQEGELRETTLNLSAYVVIDGEMVQTSLEPGISYLFPNVVQTKETKRIDYLRGYDNALTVESTGTIYVECDDAMCLITGKAENGLILEWNDYLEMERREIVAYHNTTFLFHLISQNQSGEEKYLAVPDQAPRILTISAYDGDNAELYGDPRVQMTVQLTYVKRMQESAPDYDLDGYTLEILSVERTPPAYW